MKITVSRLRKVIKEALGDTASVGIDDLIDKIKQLSLQLHQIHNLPQDVIRDIKAALVADMKTSGKLPRPIDCEIMIGGSDEDEDVQMSHYQQMFPKTFEELVSLWQLKGF